MSNIMYSYKVTMANPRPHRRWERLSYYVVAPSKASAIRQARSMAGYDDIDESKTSKAGLRGIRQLETFTFE